MVNAAFAEAVKKYFRHLNLFIYIYIYISKTDWLEVAIVKTTFEKPKIQPPIFNRAILNVLS